MGGLYMYPSLVMEAVNDGGDVVVETYDNISHNKVIGWEDVEIPVNTEVVHSVAQESSRVRLN